MKNGFDVNAYKEVIAITVKDIFYVDGLSNENRMSSIRKYTEYLVRFLIDRGEGKPLTLGNENTKRNLEKHGIVESWFFEAIETINQYGNDSIHTHKTESADENEMDEALDALATVYSYLFFNYFKKYPFGSNQTIVSYFSLLPPMIRVRTLENLFELDPFNETVIYKLVLALNKAYDSEQAIQWVDNHFDYLNKIEETMPLIIEGALCGFIDSNMYETLIGVAQQNYNLPYIPRYTDFESAVNYFFEKRNSLTIVSEEEKRFDELMGLVFTGRSENEERYV